MSVTELCFPTDDDVQSEITHESELDAACDNGAPPPRSRRTWLIAIRLRDARNSNSLNAVSSLADVFLTCSRTTIYEIHNFFPNSHNDPSYKLSKSATEFLISLLHGAKMQAQDTEIDTMLDLADMVLANLKELTRVALRATREKKPLPAVPSDINVPKPQTRPSTPGNKDASLAVRSSFFDYELVESDIDEESYRLQGLKNTTATIATRAKRCEKTCSDVSHALRQSTCFPPFNETSSKHDPDALVPIEVLTGASCSRDPDFLPVGPKPHAGRR
ncbi:hypothetical protein F5887DRAFT_946234 [Amanita rubescens]|nr:hypothetical protein F5887DRAFT_946234 [Amanita rubescens]